MSFRITLLFLFASFYFFAQTQTPEYELEYTGHYGDREYLTIELYLKNNSKDTLFIHRSAPLSYNHKSRNSVPFAPEFYSLKILSDVTLCEISPYFVDSYSAIPIKDERYFLKIPPNGQSQIIYNNSKTDQMICDEKIGEMKVKFVYDFDERFLDKEFFAKEVTEAGRLSKEKSEALYSFLEKSYQGKIESKEITIDLNNINKNGSDEVKKTRGIRKAKRQYGIEITEIFLPDYLGFFPRVDVKVADDFKEEDLETLQRNLTSSFIYRDRFHTAIIQNNEIKWFLGFNGSKRSPVHIYDYKEVLDSVNMSIQHFLEVKESSILKDYEIHSIYLSTQNMGSSSYRLIDKMALFILKDKEGNFFKFGYRKNPIHQTQLIPLTKTKDSFVEMKKSYSHMVDDQYYVFQILENGDLVMGKRETLEKGLERYQGYFIKLK